MKIIQVTANYPPSIGGVQKVAKEIAEGLSKKGYDSYVYTTDDGQPKNNDKPAGKPRVLISKSINIAHTPIAPGLFFRLMSVPRDSIFHVHVSRAFIPEIVYLVSKFRNIPYVAHFHLDVGPSGKMGFLLPYYKKHILKKVLENASKVIVLSEENKKLFKKIYGFSRNVLVVPNGVGSEYFYKRKIKQRVNKVTQLLYVGRISVQKQVDILVKSLLYIKSNVFLNIVGVGEKLPEIKKLIKENKIRNIMLHGVKTGNSLVGIYRKSDIFLLSSNKEGLPLVLIEAMAGGLPVIASDVEGTREFVGKDGILVNPNTPQKFAEEIDRVAKSRKIYNKLSEKSMKKAEQYTWEKIISQIEKIYRTTK